jgi:hypothetical protein
MKNNVALKLTIQSVFGTILKDGNPIGHLNHTFTTPYSLDSLAPRHSSPKLTARLIPSFALYKDLIFNGYYEKGGLLRWPCGAVGAF